MKAKCEYCEKKIEIKEGDWEVCADCEWRFIRGDDNEQMYQCIEDEAS